MSQVDRATTDQENQKCDICEQVFKSKQKLKRHFRSAHYKIAEAFKCNICTKYFQTQKDNTNESWEFFN